MGKIADRFDSKIQTPKTVHQKMVALVQAGDTVSALELFTSELTALMQRKNLTVSQTSGLTSEFMAQVLNNPRLDDFFKLRVGDILIGMDTCVSGSYLPNEAGIDEDDSLQFYRISVDASQVELLDEELEANVASNKNVEKYTLPEIPCLVIPLSSKHLASKDINCLPSRTLGRLKERLLALVSTETWIKFKAGPVWLTSGDAVGAVQAEIDAAFDCFMPAQDSNLEEAEARAEEDALDADDEDADPFVHSYWVLASREQMDNLLVDECFEQEQEDRIDYFEEFRQSSTLTDAVHDAAHEAFLWITERADVPEELRIGFDPQEGPGLAQRGVWLEISETAAKDPEDVFVDYIGWAQEEWMPEDSAKLVFNAFLARLRKFTQR